MVYVQEQIEVRDEYRRSFAERKTNEVAVRKIHIYRLKNATGQLAGK